MEELLQSFLPFVVNHLFLTYFLIFFAAFFESLPIVGIFFPGSLLVIFAGVIVATGALSLWTTLILAFLGATSGDNISFWLGHHYHLYIKNMWPFYKFPGLFVKGESFFKKYGGKSIFFGRFVGPVRAITCLIAGMLNMSWRRFLIFDLLAALVWSLTHVFPGYLIGGSLMVLGAVSFRLLLFIILVGFFFWIAFWLLKKIFFLLEHMSKRKERLFILFCIFFFFAIWLFLEITNSLLHLSLITQADEAIFQYLQSIRTPWGDSLMVAISEISDWVVNIFVVSTVLLLLLFFRKKWEAIFWCLTISGGWIVVLLLKWLVHRPRPYAIYQNLASCDFPSEHISMSVIIYGFFAVMLMHSLSSKWRFFPFGMALLFALLVSFSRLYLGIYWFSGVLGGLALGSAWISLMGLIYLHFSREALALPSLVLGMIIPLFLGGGFHIYRMHAKDLVRYRTQQTIHMMSVEEWWRGGWKKLPLFRVELSGKSEEPLTLQWEGDLALLRQTLEKKGWKIRGEEYKLFINLFIPHETLDRLPLLPRLENGQREALLLSLDAEGSRLVLRLWPTEFAVTAQGPFFYVGSVESEKAVTVSSLLTLPKRQRDYTEALQKLTEDIGFSQKFVSTDNLPEKILLIRQ